MTRDVGFILCLSAWAAGVGWSVLRLPACPFPRRADALALALPLGLGLLSLAVLGLGQAGRLDRNGLLALFALGGSAAALAIAVPIGGAGRWASPEVTPEPLAPPRSWLDVAFDLALAAVITGSFLTALGPVTDGDALCYHLQVPREFLAQRSVGFNPDLHETVYPLVTELLYAVALRFRGPVACRLVQWVLGLVFAANVTALARPVLGRRARWAGTIALLTPAVSNGMGAPLNDVALAAFGLASLHGWVRWMEHPSVKSALLAGLLSGLALGVKYPALVWVGLLGLGAIGWPLMARHRPGTGCPPGIRQLAGFALAAMLAGGAWYLRAAIHTGNPVYPFFRHTFGGSGIDDVLDPIKRPLEVNGLNLLLAPLWMTLQPGRFDSFPHQFGPVFLMFLPGVLLLKPPRRVSWLVALGWIFLTLCVTRRQSMRFVLIAVGPAAIGAAWVAAELSRRRTFTARAMTGILLAILGFESAIAVGHARHGLPVLLGRESVESYLSRREPTFVVGRWIAANLPASARLIGQDHRGFYLPRPYTMELAHRRRTGLGSSGEPAEAIVARLRDEGFTHLLLCPPVPETAVEFDPTLNRALREWLARSEPVYRADLTDADGVLRRYAIHELAGRSAGGLATGPGAPLEPERRRR
jgi:hypothetical protein